MEIPSLRIAYRPRGFVRVAGTDAASYLERMLSNEVEALPTGASCQALLLTAKARVIAVVTAWRRGSDDFLLLTEPDLVDRLVRELRRYRFAAKVEVEPEEHVSLLVLGAGAPAGAIPNTDYGEPAYEVLDDVVPDAAVHLVEEELELLRILARTPRMGREIDDRVLPAEAGLEARSISFTKGCYPGQEPVVRLHYRGHVNRELEVVEIEGSELPVYDAELLSGDTVVGRVTSAARHRDGIVALAFARREVPADAELSVAGRRARRRPATD